MDKNVVWHSHKVDKQKRATLKNQKPCILWFTGLSGSGKSTIAGALEEMLYKNGNHTYLLDGDNIRHGLNSDLGFVNIFFDVLYNRVSTQAKARYFKNAVGLATLLQNLDMKELEQVGSDMRDIACRNYVWEIISQKYAQVL
jgi:adenylylsulfate kinase-like enzyme